tara:strand:+ start:44 stop:709 length:666 start_codon:yes stop_codon:yes gene_type:complete
MWNKGWDKVFSEVDWGKYPGEELIRFIARNFYNEANRNQIKILEVGCGEGANIWFLSREGFDVYGLDGSKIALKKAKKFLDSQSLNANLHHGDAMNLPYDDHTFDAVLDVECIYANSLKDSSIILEEIHRVLKLNGLIFSKTFSSEMSGQETATSLEDEPNTFIKMPDGPLRDDYGIIRLTAEDEIKDIYHLFNDLQYDFISRTDRNRSNVIHEWIIQGRK